MKQLLLVIVFCCSICQVRAQLDLKQKVDSVARLHRPRIGLCLSGGGAKGLAHIGLLKLIDSLHIQVDYVTGTSMGSIVGGLYASGYSGKQIDSIAHTAEWGVLLNQYVSLDQIAIEEKDEYEKYIGELPVTRKGKVKFTGIIEGQALLSFLARLTSSVNHIHDFRRLPIPFQCMAVDIIKMQPVVLDSGFLPLALRCSMSIPSVFKPVPYGDYLLVDGGVIVNFPVTQLRGMGADIIIGSYTGGRYYDENEVASLGKIMIQTASFYGINESARQIELCDVFLNLTGELLHYEAKDFKRAEAILKIGDTSAYKVLPGLVELSKLIPGDSLAYERFRNKDRRIRIGRIHVDTNLSRQMQHFIHRRLKVEEGDTVAMSRLARDAMRLYGTRYFYKSYYSLDENSAGGSFDVTMITDPDDRYRLKGAVHYDNETGAGIYFNITARNLLGKASRLFASAALSEAPKVRLHYQKYIHQSNWMFGGSYFSERTRQRDYGLKGQLQDDFLNTYRNFTVFLQYNLSHAASLQLSQSNERSELRSRFDPYLKFDASNINIVYLKDWLNGFNLCYWLNTLNHRYFYSRGLEVYFNNKFVFNSSEEVKYAIGPSDSASTAKLSWYCSPYLKTNLRLIHALPLGHHWSLISRFNLGLIFSDLGQNFIRTPDGALVMNGQTPITDAFFIGGFEQRQRPYFLPFEGFKEGELYAYNVSILELGVQFEPITKLYIQPKVSAMYEGATAEELWQGVSDINLKQSSTDKEYPFQYSYGINLGYRTPIGPVQVNVAKAGSMNLLRVSFSLGYSF